MLIIFWFRMYKILFVLYKMWFIRKKVVWISILVEEYCNLIFWNWVSGNFDNLNIDFNKIKFFFIELMI